MPRLAILTNEEQAEFDYPPKLTAEARALCFAIPPDLEIKLNRLRTPTNKVCFLLQYGYFKICKRFFPTSRFHSNDVDYVSNLLNISLNQVHLSKYAHKMPTVHQSAILEMLNYKPMDSSHYQWLEMQTIRSVERFTEPRKLFFNLLQLLFDNRVEVPSYHRLCELITLHYIDYEEKLLNIIEANLSKENRDYLDNILNANKERSKGDLSQLKVINQSVKPKAIQASINIFLKISDLFRSLLPVIEALSLTPSSCEYYATWVKKAKLSQINQFTDKNKTYLHLIAFIQHQYNKRQDTFIDIFLKCVQSSKNTTTIRLNKSDQLSRGERRAAVRHLTKKNRNYRNVIDEIREITHSPVLSAIGKVEKIDVLLRENGQKIDEAEQERIDLLEKSLDNIVKDKDYFDTLEKQSIKLQNRVSQILKVLEFNEETSSKALISAINDYKTKDGKINSKSPKGFLDSDEEEALINENKSLRTSLYKVLLFIHASDGIKSGELNLKHSYRYLSINEYLIDKDIWDTRREELLKLSSLEHLSSYEKIISKLKTLLGEKYQHVNQRFNDGRNPYLQINKNEDFYVKTPALDDKETKHIAALLNQVGYAPIMGVLSEINQITQLSQYFKHHSVKNVKRRPSLEVFIAGIIGLGCNIGVPKMAQISSGINENTLKNAVNWYFSCKTINNANQCIIEFINKLALPKIFIANKGEPHSSSDGCKIDVAVDSLLASYSFKYFGKDKGVSIYTFIDERQVLFHSTVISASEREAAYVIDGLNNNDVVKTKIHSTDSHGYTEIIFAATHFMDKAFAPRLKNIGKQRIYAFSAKKTYEKRRYKILPSRTINQKLIADNWEDILRFMATIKLNEVTASQLFKRLSSYARNNPLYKALKEFGRIIKSLFILTYFDDVKLRQRIEKQLNRVELSNKFSRAVFYANNGAFQQGTQEEQQVVVACKVLIQNTVVLWNYLYLSQILVNCSSGEERDELIGLIKEGSVLTWGHVNLHGEFDCKRDASNDSAFDLHRIMSLQVG